MAMISILSGDLPKQRRTMIGMFLFVQTAEKGERTYRMDYAIKSIEKLSENKNNIVFNIELQDGLKFRAETDVNKFHEFIKFEGCGGDDYIFNEKTYGDIQKSKKKKEKLKKEIKTALLRACVIIIIVSVFVSIKGNNSIHIEVPKHPITQKTSEQNQISTTKSETKNAKPIAESVRADKFEVSTNLKDQKIEITLDTDLPDDTDLMFYIARTYYKLGKPKSPYNYDYISKKMHVSDWKTPQTFTLDNDVWKSGLKAFQDKLAPATMGFELDRIDDKIEVYLVVPSSQDNPAFGDRNSKLSGKAVIEEDGWKGIRKTVFIPYPLEGKEDLKEQIGNSQFTGKWRMHTSRSKIDDTNNVYLTLVAENTFDNGFNKYVWPVIYLGCSENKTEFSINFDTFLGLDTISVLHRIDKKKARTTRWNISTNNLAVFVRSPINFIRKLIRHEDLLIQITPYGENSVTAEFFLQGLSGAIKPVQKACGWE